MDTWAPVVINGNEGTGRWTMDASSFNVASNTLGPTGGQTALRVGAIGTDVAGHDTAGNQWTDAYGEVLWYAGNFSGNTGRRCGVWLRTASAANCYTVVADGGSAGNANMTISKVVASVSTSLGTTTFTAPTANGNYVTLRAEIVGDNIGAYIGGQRILTVTDTTFQGPGFVSLYMRATTTISDVQTFRWEAGPMRPNYVPPAYAAMAGPSTLSRRLR